MVGAILGARKEELLSERYAPVEKYWRENTLVPEIAEVAAGSFKRFNPPEIAGTGYVVKSLEAALWAFHKGNSFREGCLLAVNLGDDADTTGAVYGQLAGAYYAEDEIPADWRGKLAHAELIRKFADNLLRNRVARLSGKASIGHVAERLLVNKSMAAAFVVPVKITPNPRGSLIAKNSP